VTRRPSSITDPLVAPAVAAADTAALLAAAELLAAEELERLEAAAALAGAQTEESEQRVLVAAREHLGMDVSYCSHLSSTEQVIQSTHGDAASFGLSAGATFALEESFCQRVVDGRLPNLLADVRADARVAGLRPSFGAYVGVPVVFSDGRSYGTLCCASHAPALRLRQRDVAFMQILGRMLAHELERAEIQRVAQHHRNEAIALGALFAGLDARDSYTGRHSEQVVDLAVRVTRALRLPEAFVDEVKQVALLHDIGKIGIPDAILGKKGPLDAAEWAVMHTHPVIGERIVASIASLAPLAPAIRAEHERCDGKGYPDGLTREQIPLSSRITFACDAYHAMISSRPYRPEPMSQSVATAELRDKAGTQFDPDVIAALLVLLEE
jgi:GAF domain-containing protein